VPVRGLRSPGRRFIAPVGEALAALRGRAGVVAVLGNHDHWDGAAATRRALAAARIPELGTGATGSTAVAPGSASRGWGTCSRTAGSRRCLGDAGPTT
jgi:hypothetical protein